MTVVDASVVVDHLLTGSEASPLRDLIRREREVTAPDMVVFETLSALRRLALRGELDDHRAEGAVEDLGDLAVNLLPSMPLRSRAWELRRNFAAGDALFVALAESIDEPLFTFDARLATAARRHSYADVLVS